MSTMMMKQPIDCLLCGDAISGWGNNPWPLCAEDDHESRVCDGCNIEVIIARLQANNAAPKPPLFDIDGDDWMEIYTECEWNDAPFSPELNGGTYFMCWGGGPVGGYVKKGSSLWRVNKDGMFEPWTVEKQENKHWSRIVRDGRPWGCVY